MVSRSMTCDASNYVGGDDLQMKGWDQRHGFDRPIFVNKRYAKAKPHIFQKVEQSEPCRFDAGVTTIQSNPHIEYLIAVGR